MKLNRQIKKALSIVLAPYYKGLGHILMLHRVVDDSNGVRIHNPVNEITSKELEELILFYKEQNIDIIALDQLSEYLSKKTYFVVFTFDDGYKDNLTHALPVFEKYNTPFTIYLTTGFPDCKVIIWWYILEDILVQNNNVEFFWNDFNYQFDCQSLQEKEMVFNELRRIIIDTPSADQHIFLKRAFTKYTSDPFATTRRLVLTWEDVEKLANHPLVTIGAHTNNHPALNQLTTEEAENECRDSKLIIERHIKKPVNHFSYPFGSANEVGQREIDIVKKFDFTTATTTRVGVLFNQHLQHMHVLPRIAIKPDLTLENLQRIIMGQANAERGLKKRVVTL